MEHLNHVVSGVPSPRDPAQPQQWVSSQVLLCRRCSHHQTTKIKQLAAFTPREEVSTPGWESQITGRTPWTPEPARTDGSVPEKREVEALGSNCSLRGRPPGLIHQLVLFSVAS